MLHSGLTPSRKMRQTITLSLAFVLSLFHTVLADAQVTLSTTALNFGTVVLNQKSAVQTVSIKNNQATTQQNLTFTLPALTLYALAPASTTCVNGSALASGASCTVGLTFNPKSGSIPSTSSLSVNTTGNTVQKVALSGTPLSQVTLSTNVVNFGNVAINETSALQTVTVINNQATALTFSSLSVTAGTGYSMNPASTCLNPTLAAGASCTVVLTLTPTTLGAQPAGTLTILGNSSSPIPTVSLIGTGVPQVLVSPASLTFAAQFIGTTSAPQTVTVTNEQISSLSIPTVTISGANPSDFAVVNSCPIAPSTLGSGVPCTLAVTFTPTISGTRTATLNIHDNAPGGSQTVPLTGTANAPVTLSTGLINNFTAPVGATSPYQTITITNNNTGAPLHINVLQLSGDFQQTSTSCGNTLPYALASGASCNVTVSFAPTISGTRTGQLQVFDDAGTSPQVVNLSGVGTSPLTIAPTQLIYSAEKLGTTSSSQAITLTNHESKAETYSISVTGDFAATSSCSSGIIPDPAAPLPLPAGP